MNGWRPTVFFLFFCFLLGLPVSFASGGDGVAVLQGVIVDAGQRPVAGAEVALYLSEDVRRPAAYKSNRTAGDGRYRLAVPAGDYWAVAAQRRDDAESGPLGLADRHSGPPVAVSLRAGREKEKRFEVLDLRQAARRLAREKSTLVPVRGRVLDAAGKPVVMAYAVADTVAEKGGLPRHVSAWTGVDGVYELMLPPGGYFLGAARQFPQTGGYRLPRELEVREEVAGVDLELASEP